MARLAHSAVGAASREIRHELKRGASWADAHVSSPKPGLAVIAIDSSFGWSSERHPERGESPNWPTTIFVEFA